MAAKVKATSLRSGHAVRDVMELLHRHAFHRQDTRPQAGHDLQVMRGARLAQRSLEGREIVGLDVDEVETWRARGQGAGELVRETAANLGHRHQRGQAGTRGKQHKWQGGSRAVEAAQAEGECCIARFGEQGQKTHQQRRNAAQQHQGDNGTGAKT